MKTYLKYIFLILSVSFFFCSCSEEEFHEEKEEEIKDEIEILSELSLFDNNKTDQTVTFFSANSWKATTDQLWCSVSPMSGKSGKNTVKVTVQPNEEYNERNAALILTSGVIQKHLTIIQKQNHALLLTSSKKEISSAGGIIDVSVESNVEFSYSIEESAIEWVVPISSRGLKTTTLRFKVKENEQVDKREAKIFFESGDLSESFTIYQEGTTPEFVLTQNEFNVGSEGDEIKVELKSNFPYEIHMPKVDWVQQVKERSLSTFTHYFKISPNNNYENRTTEIVFKQINTGKSQIVTINQLQKDELIVNDNDYVVEADGGTISIDLKTNVSFDVTCPSWIKQQGSKGRALLNKKLLFQVEKNPTNIERKGIILLQTGQILKEIKVLQKGRFGIEIIKGLSNFGSKKETQQIIFNSLADWTASNNETWCTISPRLGKAGRNIIDISVDEINNIAQRQDSLYIKSGSLIKSFPIIQNNQDSLLIVTPDIEMSGKNDTIISVKVKASYDISYVIPDSIRNWVIPLKSRSLQEKVLKFKVLKNSNVLGRSGVIRFNNGERYQDFKLSQRGIGPLMSLSAEKLEIGSVSSEFEITIKSNYKYRIWNDGEIKWIKLIDSTPVQSQEPGFIVTKHRFKVDENVSIDLRIGYVHFYNTEYIKEFGQIEDKLIRVFQKSKYTIEPHLSFYNVPASGQILTFDVLSDVNFSVETPDSWITQLPETRGVVKNTTLKFRIDPNTNIEQRKGSIILSYLNWNKKVTILQEEFKDFGILLVDSLSAFESNGGTQQLTFNASESWTASVNASWCKISTLSGKEGQNKISVTADKNPNYQSRSAKLIFRCGRHSKEITITQKQDDHIEVEKDAYTLTWNTTDFNLNVKSNCNYSVEVTSSGNWIRRKDNSRALVSKTIPFVLDKNEGKDKREATITLKYNDVMKKVRVTQNALDSLTIITPNVTLANVNDTIIKVKLVSSANVTPKVDENAKAWIILQTPSRALTTSEYSFKVLKNVIEDRTGTISFSNGTKSANFMVKQKGKGLKLQTSTQTIEVGCTETEKEITVTANFKYELMFEGDWIKETSSDLISTGENGMITTKHHLMIAANESVNPRSMNVKFNNVQYPSLGQVNSVVLVNQKGKDDIKIAQASYNVPAKGQELSVFVESNVDYSVTTSDSWIKYISESKNGFTKNTLRFVIANSKVTEKREGTITLTSPLCTKTITISQEAFDDYGIRLNNSLTEFSDKGGKQQLSFGTSQNWVAIVIDQSWCHMPDHQGDANENNVLNITVAPNPGFEPRTTDIIINSGKKQQTIKVTQKGMERIIELSQSSFNVDAKTTELNVSVNANCEYTVQSNVSWITQKPSTKAMSATQVVLSLEINSDTKERTGTVDIISEGIKKTITVIQAANVETKPEPGPDTNPDVEPDPDAGTDPQPEVDPQPGTEEGQTEA